MSDRWGQRGKRQELCLVYLETTFRISKATNIKKDAQRPNFTFKFSFEGCDHQFVTYCKLHDVVTV